MGYTEVYGSTSTAANRRAVPVTFTEDGKISSVSIYHNGGTGHILLGVYSDASGYPGTRLGVTASTVVSGTEGWQEVMLTDSVAVVSGETVWLAFVFENSVGIRYKTGTPGRAMSTETWSSGMPSGFGVSGIAGYQYSVYCTYSTGTLVPEPPAEQDLGNTTIYSSISTAPNRRAVPVTFTEDGEISSISIYHNGGTGNILLGVYSDASGYPGTKLGETVSTAVNATAGWQEVMLTDSVAVVSGETVWLAFVFEKSVGIRYETGTPGRAMSTETWSSGMPSDFGTSGIANYNYSLYCTYSVINNKSAVTELPIVAENSKFRIEPDNFIAFQGSKLKAYPNPFMNELKIEFNKQPDERLLLSIYDIQGRLLLQMENELEEGFNQFVWNRNDSMGNRVKSGIYFVQLTSDTRKEVFKVVCQGD